MNIINWSVNLLHVLLLIFLFVSVFINKCNIKEIAYVILMFVLVKYLLGLHKCFFVQLEYKILGKERYKKGFLYNLVEPITTVPKNYFSNGSFVLHIVWIIILAWQLNRMGCDLFSLL